MPAGQDTWQVQAVVERERRRPVLVEIEVVYFDLEFKAKAWVTRSRVARDPFYKDFNTCKKLM